MHNHKISQTRAVRTAHRRLSGCRTGTEGRIRKRGWNNKPQSLNMREFWIFNI